MGAPDTARPTSRLPGTSRGDSDEPVAEGTPAIATLQGKVAVALAVHRGMNAFSDQVLEAAAREREVELTTYGRRSGDARRTILWVWGDGRRLFIRSGGGMGRDWPQNLLAQRRAVLHVGGLDVPVIPRHVTDLAEVRSLHQFAVRKYGSGAQSSIGNDAPTPAELATFELLPVAAAS